MVRTAFEGCQSAQITIDAGETDRLSMARALPPFDSASPGGRMRCTNATSESKKVVYAAMVANAAIAAAKLIAGAGTGSSAMLSEAVHSIADTANEALLLLGLARGRRPADAQHPFGHGLEVYFWGLIVAVVLFGLGGGLSLYEGTHALRHPEPLGDPRWSYTVLAVALIAETVSWVVAMRAFRRRQGGRHWWSAFVASKDPTLFTPLAEDTAALVGLGVAFAGVFVSQRLDRPEPDAIASLVIGAILCAVAVFLANETKGLLMGEAMDPALRERVRAVVRDDPAVVEVPGVMSLHLGPEEILLVLRVVFASSISASELPAILDRLRRRLRAQDDRLRRVFLEPAASQGLRGRLEVGRFGAARRRL
jgi:cation diffusion facilitator family transporter